MAVATRLKGVVLGLYPRAGEVKRAVTNEPATGGGARPSTTQRQGRRLDALERRLARAEARISELEDEVQESRRLNRRIAELTDIVAEVLLPEGQRDDVTIRARLADYDASVSDQES